MRRRIREGTSKTGSPHVNLRARSGTIEPEKSQGRPPRCILTTLMQRLRGTLGSAGQKKSGREVGPQAISIPLFASADSFSFVPTAVEVEDLKISFRLQQWGGFAVAGQCIVVVMHYAVPSFDRPCRSIEIYQRDLASSKVIPDWRSSDDGRQEAELREHQRLYELHARELWFHHASKRTLTLEALPTSTIIMDSWHGPRRNHQVFRAFVGTVVWRAIFAGFAEHEALEILQQRLTPVAPDSRLAAWHDEQHRMHAGGPFHV